MISLIAAVAENGVIGGEGRLLWHLPEELRYFKQVTLNKPIIMGRKTFESLGKPLPNRRNIVISRQQKVFIGAEVVSSLSEALHLASDAPEVMVIGGGQIFEQAFPLADRLYLTIVHLSVEGDTFFPAWASHEWQLISQEEKSSAGVGFECCLYERIKST